MVGNCKTYLYCAISKSFGYNVVDILAGSLESAMELGQREFSRQFGDGCFYSCGDFAWNLNIDEQIRLCQCLMDGFKETLPTYCRIIQGICRRNGLVVPGEEHIKYLFVNSVAGKYKVPGKCELVGVVQFLLQFMELCKAEEALNDMLYRTYYKAALSGAKRDYRRLCEVSNPDGVVKTKNGVFNIRNGVVSHDVNLVFNEICFGRVNLLV